MSTPVEHQTKKKEDFYMSWKTGKLNFPSAKLALRLENANLNIESTQSIYIYTIYMMMAECIYGMSHLGRFRVCRYKMKFLQ